MRVTVLLALALVLAGCTQSSPPPAELGPAPPPVEPVVRDLPVSFHVFAPPAGEENHVATVPGGAVLTALHLDLSKPRVLDQVAWTVSCLPVKECGGTLGQGEGPLPLAIDLGPFALAAGTQVTLALTGGEATTAPGMAEPVDDAVHADGWIRLDLTNATPLEQQVVSYDTVPACLLSCGDDDSRHALVVPRGGHIRSVNVTLTWTSSLPGEAEFAIEIGSLQCTSDCQHFVTVTGPSPLHLERYGLDYQPGDDPYIRVYRPGELSTAGPASPVPTVTSVHVEGTIGIEPGTD